VTTNVTARHEWIPLTDRERWRAALVGIEHDLGHTWEYCHALSLTDARPISLYAYTDGATRVVCPLQEREYEGHRDVSTLPGFSGFVGTGPHPDFAARWVEQAAARGLVCGYIGLSPFLSDGSYERAGEVHERNSVYVLDLREEPDTLLARFDRNRRRQLRRWDAIAASLVHDRARLVAFLVREYPAFLDTVGASASYRRSDATLQALCALDSVLVVGTEDAEGISSVYVFGCTPTIGTCLFHVARPQARQHATALVWWGVTALRARGVRLLNLGGGVREHDAIAASKQRFGSTRLPMRALKQVYRPGVYTALCRGAGVDPDDVTGFFPPYRAPRAAPVA
jgi:hypothetical protein